MKADLVGEIEVGGPKFAASLTKIGLIDEYQLFLHPVVLARGRPFFVGLQPRLRLVASDRIGESPQARAWVKELAEAIKKKSLAPWVGCLLAAIEGRRY